ncbi:carbon-nitrogen hydrolase family protein [Brevibacillus fluminis]|uniref:Carbon-nitrogen hydrolase family protein n=1 Tax=Brevibacillus fluminis TaxID=511487 RepID=A0A3M8DQX6_9BACL|nr:carbon-nitrogen hydrolase family protein [Brevibacillus fluminis]RNB89939.1 carbon-nitrogen hydrolase family protein [Brevibacillus fluminis]
MRIAMAQFAPHLGDKEANIHLMTHYLNQAKTQQADLVIFPELALTGYSVGEQLGTIAETTEGPSLATFKERCKELGIAALVSFPERNGNRFHISSAYIDEDGTIAGVYRKTHLFSSELDYFTPGDEWPVFSTKHGKIGMMICYDLEFPEVARLLRLNGAELILVSTANMVPYQNYQNIYMQSRAMENEVPLAICNRLGTEGDLIFFGHSMAVDHEGRIVLHMGDKEDVQTADISLNSEKDTKLNYAGNLHPLIRQSLLTSLKRT